jgi:hypothetical protein
VLELTKKDVPGRMYCTVRCLGAPLLVDHSALACSSMGDTRQVNYSSPVFVGLQRVGPHFRPTGGGSNSLTVNPALTFYWRYSE